MRIRLAVRLLPVACLLLGARVAPGQCANTWNAVGSPIPTVRELVVLPNGNPVAAVPYAPGSVFSNLAEWNGVSWNPLGAGLTGIVNAMTLLPNGDLVVAGYLSGLSSSDVARWDGATWSAFGAPSYFGDIQAMATDANDRVVVGGYIQPQVWTGTAWTPLGGTTGPSGYGLTTTLRKLRNGNLIAAGSFEVIGSPGPFPHNIALWDGIHWNPLGPGQLPNIVYDVAELANGGLVAVGYAFSGYGYVLEWDGVHWHGLGGPTASGATIGYAYCVETLPNGDVLIAGDFSDIAGVPANGVARWNGSSWTPVGPGISGLAFAKAWTPDGDLLLGGDFTTIGGGPSALARLGTTCPASAIASGLGCPSSGGANTLVARSLPWVDATFRAEGSGLPALALVIAATSFTSVPQGVLPLSSLFAQAPAGCDLLVAPDILQGYVTTTGTLETSFFLPSAPPIVGMPFFQQLVPFELDALGNLAQITATNALSMTAGAF